MARGGDQQCGVVIGGGVGEVDEEFVARGSAQVVQDAAVLEAP
jgi:hypothetical protein